MADYSFPGDVEIGEITIVSHGGEVFNITEMYLECNIYQSIFKHYLECEIAIHDALNINHEIKGNVDSAIASGFRGGEVLIVQYRERTDPSQDAKVPFKRHMFGIYEMSDRSKFNENSETYILSAISFEAFQTIPQKISKTYGARGGGKVSNMITSIIAEYILPETMLDNLASSNILKNVVVDETSGIDTFTIPNMSVDKTIDYLSREADSPDYYPLYTFYEDSNGYNFRNISKLVAEPEVMDTYFYYPSNYEDATNNEELEASDEKKIISYDMIKDNNILENTKNGLFKSRTIGVDILRKKTTERKFEYIKEKDKFSTLNGSRFNVEVVGDPVLNVKYTTFGHDNDSFFNNDNTVMPKKDFGIGNRKQSYFHQIFNNVMQVSIPGDSSKNVGEIIYLIFFLNNDIEANKYQIDKTLSGRYLITKVRQKITDDFFTTIMECSKDTNLI